MKTLYFCTGCQKAFRTLRGCTKHIVNKHGGDHNVLVWDDAARAKAAENERRWQDEKRLQDLDNNGEPVEEHWTDELIDARAGTD